MYYTGPKDDIDSEASGISRAMVKNSGSGKLFVTELPNEIEEQDLYTLFSEYGNVTEVRIVTDGRNQLHKSKLQLFVYVVRQKKIFLNFWGRLRLHHLRIDAIGDDSYRSASWKTEISKCI